MSQQFNGEVEQVAGNDIINKNNIINIHLPAATTERQKELVSRAIRTLLSTCDEANCRTEMYKISQTLFSTSFFKELNLEQLTKLQVIADEIRAVQQSKDESHAKDILAIQQAQDDSHSIFTREMDEYEDFYRRTGIRASRPERAALIELMTHHPFTVKKIKCVWREGILIYADDRLQTKLPVWEPLLGMAAALICGAALVLILAQVLLVKPPIQELMTQGIAFLAYVCALIVSANYMIAPAYIGKRIKAVIEKD